VCEHADGTPCGAAVDASANGDASLPDGSVTPPLDGSAPDAEADVGTVVVATVAPCLVTGNVVYVNGDPDDPVHPGEATYTFPSGNDPGTSCGGYAGTRDAITMACPAAFGSGSSFFSFFFRTANGQPLTVGVYEGALGGPANDGKEPDMIVQAGGAYGGDCFDYPLGRFQIERLSIDSTGHPHDVVVSFEQQCSLHAGKLRGCLHFVQ